MIMTIIGAANGQVRLICNAILTGTFSSPFTFTVAAAAVEASIKLVRFQVPERARTGDTRKLSCQYDLYGETLHAMKLFKDDKEVRVG